MTTESLTYSELGDRLGSSAEAARSLARRLRLVRKPGNDGKVRVIVDLAEIQHRPAPTRSPDRPDIDALNGPLVRRRYTWRLRDFRRTGCQGGVAAMIIAHMRRNALRDTSKIYATGGIAKKAGARSSSLSASKRRRYTRAVFGPQVRRFPKRHPAIEAMYPGHFLPTSPQMLEELLRRSLELERSVIFLLSAHSTKRKVGEHRQQAA